MDKKKARIIAFYLPQYHPIPENDEVWGKGFTEWTNVSQAKPLFRGHYQPRIPADLGYYDLRLEEVREAQAEMARNAGIEGFMYWHYWFGKGKMLLQRPFKEVLESQNPQFPFCLGWANHDWQTKTWTKNSTLKGGRQMIMKQLYPGVEDYIDHFNYCLPAFEDKRYIRLNNKPIFYIWNVNDNYEQIKIFIETWQSQAKQHEMEIHFVARRYRKDSKQHILDSGVNAINDERTWNAESTCEKLKRMKTLRYYLSEKIGVVASLDKYNYENILNYLTSDLDEDLDVYPTLICGYDRSPRAGKKATIYYNFTPKNWEKHVIDVLNRVKRKSYNENIIFLKSWNEWGESNYIEPDIKYGHMFLDILKKHLYSENV
jgi:hypothetical protein